jgi:hypothetical protein
MLEDFKTVPIMDSSPVALGLTQNWQQIEIEGLTLTVKKLLEPT